MSTATPNHADQALQAFWDYILQRQKTERDRIWPIVAALSGTARTFDQAMADLEAGLAASIAGEQESSPIASKLTEQEVAQLLGILKDSDFINVPGDPIQETRATPDMGPMHRRAVYPAPPDGFRERMNNMGF